MVATRLTRLPYIGLPDQVTLRTEEVVTQVVPTDAPLKPEIVPLWIVVLSACAGAVILLLLIFLLWKVSLDLTYPVSLSKVLFFIQCHHMSLMDFVVSHLVVAEV
jgi:hypothetical protein